MIGRSMMINTSVTELYLSCNVNNKVFFFSFLFFFTINKTNNNIGDEGAMRMSNVLAKNTTLTLLNLYVDNNSVHDSLNKRRRRNNEQATPLEMMVRSS